jgi:hypothetical protein
LDTPSCGDAHGSQLQGRGVHPSDLGHVPREVRQLDFTRGASSDCVPQVGLHGHLLELRRRALRSSPPVTWRTRAHRSFQTYVYAVVYMASHDPSAYRFSTLTYVFLFTTLLTAYFMCVPDFVRDTRSRLTTLGHPAGTRLCRRSHASRCRPRACSPTARPSPSFLGARSRTRSSFRPSMG